MRASLRTAITGLAATAALLTAAGCGSSHHAAGATVRVDPTHPGATLQKGAVGVDEPIWNPAFSAAPVRGLIKQSGVTTLEFNGGPVSDLYHWQSGTAGADPDPKGHPSYTSIPPKISFDAFEQAAEAAGATTLVHVNYGTGTPQEAADWVRYATGKGYPVAGWIVGEETWGDGGIPGVNFEPDAHADKSPQAYATDATQFISAIKGADPSAKVGIEVGQAGPGPFEQWDTTVVKGVGAKADFVDVHNYPFGLNNPSGAALLAQPKQIPASLTALRHLLDTDASPRTGIVVGETNSAVTSGPQQITQVNALYLADDLLTTLEHGATGVDWWALQNGGFGQSKGDLGLLSTGDCNDAHSVCAPPAGTPFRPYFAMQLVGQMTHAGGTFLPVTSADRSVIGYAVRQPDGRIDVLLDDENPTTAQAVNLAVPGYQVTSTMRFTPTSRTVERAGDPSNLPPYSLTLAQLAKS